ncbi:MAG: iron-sulfur cluster assembly accessory protein [Anaerolineales bacterium]|nr:iron-sulfur cluster assembly accessory protein [Anaerolineales bacterium]
MITITEAAQEKIQEILAKEEETDLALRMQIMGRGPGGFRYSLRFVPESEQASTDERIEFDSFAVLIDAESAENMQGSSVDFKQDTFRSGFMIDNPNPVWKDPTAQSIQDLLDSKINPSVGAHGGFVSLLNYEDGTAFIAFGGGCQGCGMVDVTLKQGVEVMIKEEIPAVTTVVDTTDHTSGESPFYASKQGESAL